MYGPEIANAFLKLYLKAHPKFKYDPYWDLETIFDMCFPEPPFYHPWAEFGIVQIAAPILRERIEAYLGSVMQNLAS